MNAIDFPQVVYQRGDGMWIPFGTLWLMTSSQPESSYSQAIVVPYLTKEIEEEFDPEAVAMIRGGNLKFVKSMKEKDPYDTVWPVFKDWPSK